MKKVASVVLTAAVCALVAVPAIAKDCPTGQIMVKNACVEPTPDQSLQLLKDGNKDFVKGKFTTLNKLSDAKHRQALGAAQNPFAVVLTCSDSRVPPEVLFDMGLGEIFVVRVAGNVVAPHEIGSIEYGVEHLGANLIVVLGHERCGAVKATYTTYPGHVTEGSVGSLTDDIYPAVDTVVKKEGGTKPTDATAQATQVEECIVENMKNVAESLEPKSTILKEKVDKGELKIVRAKYDLDTGVVDFDSYK